MSINEIIKGLINQPAPSQTDVAPEDNSLAQPETELTQGQTDQGEQDDNVQPSQSQVGQTTGTEQEPGIGDSDNQDPDAAADTINAIADQAESNAQEDNPAEDAGSTDDHGSGDKQAEPNEGSGTDTNHDSGEDSNPNDSSPSGQDDSGQENTGQAGGEEGSGQDNDQAPQNSDQAGDKEGQELAPEGDNDELSTNLDDVPADEPGTVSSDNGSGDSDDADQPDNEDESKSQDDGQDTANSDDGELVNPDVDGSEPGDEDGASQEPKSDTGGSEEDPGRSDPEPSDEQFSDQGERVEQEAQTQADVELTDKSDAPVSELERAQKTIEDAQEISDRLGQVARIIADRFPTSNEAAQAGKNDPALRLAQVSLEALTAQTAALVGSPVNLDESDPAVIGTQRAVDIVQANLVNVTDQLTDLPQFRAKLTEIAQLRNDVKAVDSPGSVVNAELYDALNVNGVFDVDNLNKGGVYSRIAQTLAHWLKDVYVETFLYQLIKDGEASVPTVPYIADLTLNNRALTDRLTQTFNIHAQASSPLLPGNQVLVYWLSNEEVRSSTNGREGVLRLAYLSPERKNEQTKLPLPSNVDIRRIHDEYAACLEALTCFNSVITYLSGVTAAFKAWLKDAELDEAQALAVQVLLAVNAPVVDLTLACVKYVRALGDYVSLQAN